MNAAWSEYIIALVVLFVGLLWWALAHDPGPWPTLQEHQDER